jgi:IS5 family transposase
MLTKIKLLGNCRFYAEKAYKSKEHDGLLKEKKIKNGIQYKAVRGKKLRKRELEFNRLEAQIRYTAERSFGSIKSWFKGGTAKYLGLAKTHYGGYSFEPHAHP